MLLDLISLSLTPISQSLLLSAVRSDPVKRYLRPCQSCSKPYKGFPVHSIRIHPNPFLLSAASPPPLPATLPTSVPIITLSLIPLKPSGCLVLGGGPQGLCTCCSGCLECSSSRWLSHFLSSLCLNATSLPTLGTLDTDPVFLLVPSGTFIA